MVSIHVIGIFPAQRLHRRISFGTQTGRLRADEGVLAVGFVPDRNEGRAKCLSLNAGLELRPALPAKTVAQTERKFVQSQKRVHKYLIELNKLL